MAERFRFEELSLTKWMDPGLKFFAEQAKIPVEQFSTTIGGEGIGTAIESLIDLFSKGVLNKALNVFTGMLSGGYAIFGKDVPDRLKRELVQLGIHELLRFVDPKPSDLIELRRSIDDLLDAVRRNDMEGVRAALLRSPSELQAALQALGVPVGRPTGRETPPAGGSSHTNSPQDIAIQTDSAPRRADLTIQTDSGKRPISGLRMQ